MADSWLGQSASVTPVRYRSMFKVSSIYLLTGSERRPSASPLPTKATTSRATRSSKWGMITPESEACAASSAVSPAAPSSAVVCAASLDAGAGSADDSLEAEPHATSPPSMATVTVMASTFLSKFFFIFSPSFSGCFKRPNLLLYLISFLQCGIIAAMKVRSCHPFTAPSIIPLVKNRCI